MCAIQRGPGRLAAELVSPCYEPRSQYDVIMQIEFRHKKQKKTKKESKYIKRESVRESARVCPTYEELLILACRSLT
jgi:hypothetical protein